MRNAFVKSLVEMADSDPSIVLLTGDLGYTVLEPFAERFPERFFNCGVAEQNMVGVATGLASDGFTPFVYSIATFASMRPYEFIRNGPILHDLPVCVVGVGGGFDYGHNGVTHYALEDVALMRAQPGMAVIVPADREQVGPAVRAIAELGGPAYLRLGKGGEPIPELDGRFRIGRVETIAEGTDLAIFTYGSIASEATRAAALLAERGLTCTVSICASLSPAPDDDLADLLATVPLAITLESHYTTGGLGSLVAEVVADRGLDCRLLRRGIVALPSGDTGSPDYLLDRHGLSAKHVANAALHALQVS